MKLSTKGRYGARAMLELALNYEKGPLQLREIAKRQEISERYLERMMTAFVSAGLVTSLRGQHGGFCLAKPPGEIRLSRVIEVVEGPIALVACVDNPKSCKRSAVCITNEIWKKLKKAMLEVLDSVTLANMAEMQKKKLAKPKAQIYYI